MYEKILNLRKTRGWSQEELAERIGVSRQAISRWESGAAKPEAEKIIALCQLFGVSADYLLGLPEADRPPIQEKKEAPAVQVVTASVVQTQLRPILDRASGGWALAVLSALLIALFFILEEATMGNYYWLLWLGVGGLLTGIGMGPAAGLLEKPRVVKHVGGALTAVGGFWTAFCLFFGLFGDWELEILYPALVGLGLGLALRRMGKKMKRADA